MDTDDVDAANRGRWLHWGGERENGVYMFWMWLLLRWHCCSNHCDEFMVFLVISLSLTHSIASRRACFVSNEAHTSVMFQWRHLNYVCFQLYPVLEMHDTWTRFTDTELLCGFRYISKNPIDKISLSLSFYVLGCTNAIVSFELVSVSLFGSLRSFYRLTSLIVLNIRLFFLLFIFFCC